MSQNLTELLMDAADGRNGAVSAFFELLLNSKIYLPRREKLGETISLGHAPLIGHTKLADLGYLVVEYEGNETLPIFTQPEFAHQWAERDLMVEEKEFKALLQLIGDDTWLYLNPSQEVGKELTPWEVAQLRKGEEAISDLVAALDENASEEIIVHASADLYPELKTALRPVLEIYAELEEAFLVTVQDGDDGVRKPMLGIRYGNIPEAKKIYLRSEFENISKESLPREQQLVVVDDLGDKNSPNLRIFAEATPFYISQKQSSGKNLSIAARLMKHLKRDVQKKE